MQLARVYCRETTMEASLGPLSDQKVGYCAANGGPLTTPVTAVTTIGGIQSTNYCSR